MENNNVQRALYSPREVQQMLSLSNATVYRLINSGKVDARRLGGRTLITRESVDALLASLPKAVG